MPITAARLIWMDGQLVAWSEAKVHVLTHALHYGSGVFEGIRAYETKKGTAVFRLDEHIARLFRSAKIHMMEIPFTPDELIEATKLTVRENGLESGYVRPIAFRGYGEMGLNPLNAPVQVSIAAWPWGAYLGDEGFTKGVRMMVSSWKRSDPNVIPPAAKATGQYLNSSLAKVQAIKAGYDEAVMLSPEGFVADATGENIFVVKDESLVTPSMAAGPLGGITRDCIIAIAKDLDVAVHETDVVRSDLYTADEVFLTGTAAEIVPVRSVDDRELGPPGPMTKKLQEAFFAATKGEVERYSAWNDYV